MNRLPQKDMEQFTHLLCKKTALDLDAEDYSFLPIVSDLLLEMPVETVTTAVRVQIGIERCVQHCLDEANPFQKVLKAINTEYLDDPEVTDVPSEDQD